MTATSDNFPLRLRPEKFRRDVVMFDRVGMSESTALVALQHCLSVEVDFDAAGLIEWREIQMLI
jgi:hypothetical protein